MAAAAAKADFGEEENCLASEDNREFVVVEVVEVTAVMEETLKPVRVKGAANLFMRKNERVRNPNRKAGGSGTIYLIRVDAVERGKEGGTAVTCFKLLVPGCAAGSGGAFAFFSAAMRLPTAAGARAV